MVVASVTAVARLKKDYTKLLRVNARKLLFVIFLFLFPPALLQLLRFPYPLTFNLSVQDPVPYIEASPLHSNILEWHYVIRGAPSTPYEGSYNEIRGTLVELA